MINDKIRNEFLENGVVLLKQIIEPHWILELQKGLEYNFKIQVNISVFMRSIMVMKFSMMIIVIGIG